MSRRSEPGGATDGLSALLLRHATVVSDTAAAQLDVLVIGDRIAAISDGIGDVEIPGVPVEVVDLAGRLVLPALIDHHCHPTGGGGGGGPQTQNLPLLLEDFTTAGVGTFVGCLGHDTSVRRPEALLSRVRALRALGLRGHMFTGEITTPPATLSGRIDTDLFLFDEVRGLKASVGEFGSLATAKELAEAVRLVARGSRTAGKQTNVHLHVGQNADCLELVDEAVSARLVAPSVITLTHVNWNRDVLDAAIELAGRGVNIDVTACIRPDYFGGAIGPARAVAEIITAGTDLTRVSVSSDAGGSHADNASLVRHTPGLLLDTLRTCLATGLAPHRLATVFAASTSERLGLSGVGSIRPGAFADLLVIAEDGADPVSVFLSGRAVVRDGEPLAFDPIGVRA